MSRYRTTYRTARLVAHVISLLGWLLLTCGIIGLAVTFYGAFMGYEQYLRHTGAGGDGTQILLSSISTITIYLSLSGLVSGLLMIAGGQLTRAVVDNADYSGQILATLKEMDFERSQMPR